MKCYKIILAILIVAIYSSCTKTASKKHLPPADTRTKFTVPPQPQLKIEKLTASYVYPDGSGFDRTTEFEYDSRNRLTSVYNVENNLFEKRYIYTGDELVGEILQDDLPDAALRHDTSITFSTTGDTVVLKYMFEDRQVRYTYRFTDSVLSEYIYIEEKTNSTNEQLQTTTWLYAADGNLRERRFTLFEEPARTDYSVWETDNHPNVFRHVTRFLHWCWPGAIISGMSRNNVTQIRTSSGEYVRFNYTYNANGFPSTIISSMPSNYPNIKIDYSD